MYPYFSVHTMYIFFISSKSSEFAMWLFYKECILHCKGAQYSVLSQDGLFTISLQNTETVSDIFHKT